MIKKSRFVLALGLVLALGVGGMAFGDGASENTAEVDGKLQKAKMDKKQFKPNQLFSGVRTETSAPLGTQSNPSREKLNYPKNMKFDLDAGSECTASLPNGATAQQARDMCPEDSFLGEGAAEVIQPNGQRISDIVVSVFKGPARNGVRLHTYSPTLQAASPTVPGVIEKANAGSEFGDALLVANAPETGSLMITKFNATITKGSKAVLARCKDKTMTFQRDVTYKDGSKETAEITQKCKQK